METQSIINKKLGKGVLKGDEYYVRCPFCIGAHTGTSRKTLGINLKKKIYGCVRCGSAGFLSDLIGKEIKKEIKIEKEKQPYFSNRRIRINMDGYKSFVNENEWDSGHSNSFRRSLIYAKKRGFIKVECGHMEKHPYYVIFPVIDLEGYVVYYQGRYACRMDTLLSAGHKTINPKGSTLHILYSPYGIINRRLIIVEGIADAIAVKGNAVLGSNLSRDQLKFVDKIIEKRMVDEVIVWFDNEEEAITKMNNLAIQLKYRYLSSSVKISRIKWPCPNFGNDPDEIQKDQRVYLLDHRIQV